MLLAAVVDGDQSTQRSKIRRRTPQFFDLSNAGKAFAWRFFPRPDRVEGNRFPRGQWGWWESAVVQPMRTTDVADRCVVRVAGRVWWRGESAGIVRVSSPTMEKSAALACRRQVASTDLVRSTAMVAFALVADGTSKPSSRDVTGGFDPITAAHVSHPSPASTTTASTPISNGRRDLRSRP